MTYATSELWWLPAAPSDFRDRCRAIEADPTGAGTRVRRLATHALDELQLRKLAATLAALREAGVSLAPLQPFRLGVVGNATLAPLAPALVASAARHGVALECVLGDFGQTLAEAIDAHGAINTARCDAVLIALDQRGLPLAPGLDRPAEAEARVDEALGFIRSLRNGFRMHGGAPSIVQSLAAPPVSVLGSFDRLAPGSSRSLCADFNAALASEIRGSDDVFFDVGALAESVGAFAWHSPTQWNIAKFPFDATYLPLYAEQLARLLGALRGQSRKCLVLDLDNTLWGGVIGDDGIEGIVVGQGDATGEAHLDVQRTALALRERGIVLAVSSKNDDALARSGFAHPDMVLREEHIAVFQANWNDKASNIAAIANELNLGLDALVFLDDNPVERGLVRELLPDVAVPDLPDDPAMYARTLLAAGYFEAIAFSAEDRGRAEYYATDARRVALQREVGDLDAYLASLDMTIGFRPFDATGRSRIAQLINKSNQFNLTTRRYTEDDVAELETDDSCFTLQVRLADRFGDNGMIGVVVCRSRDREAVWDIDTWLMSCRVLGRRVEVMTLREIVFHARLRGVDRLIGHYLPTAKNAMVGGHYEKLGFTAVHRDGSGATTWSFPTDAHVEPVPMTVDRSGFVVATV